MLKIRLLRVGRKHDPSFRLVAVDSRRAPQSGGYLENLGFYDACDKTKKNLQINEERIKYWLSKGAQTSDTVHNILISEGVIKGKKIDVSAKSKKKEEKPAQSPEGNEAGPPKSESFGGEEIKEKD